MAYIPGNQTEKWGCISVYTTVPSVTEISDDLFEKASGAGTSFSTGGMITKLSAAKICFEAGIDMVITNGQHFEIIFDILEGKEIGTHFHPLKVLK